MSIPAQQIADLLLVNGQILAMDSHASIHQAIAIRGSHIHAVGSITDLQSLAGQHTRFTRGMAWPRPSCRSTKNSGTLAR
jgi:hypothetical protein